MSDLYVNQYESKKHGQRIQIMGPVDQWEDAGLPIGDDVEEYKTGYLMMRGGVEEMQPWADAVKSWYAAQQYESFRAWATSPKTVDLDVREDQLFALMEMKEFSRHTLISGGLGMERREATALTKLLFDDQLAIINGNKLILNSEGFQAIRECLDMIKLMKED